MAVASKFADELNGLIKKATDEMGSAVDDIVKGFEKNADGAFANPVRNIETLQNALNDYRTKNTPDFMINTMKDVVEKASKEGHDFSAYINRVEKLQPPAELGKNANQRAVNKYNASLEEYRKNINEIYQEFNKDTGVVDFLNPKSSKSGNSSLTKETLNARIEEARNQRNQRKNKGQVDRTSEVELKNEKGIAPNASLSEKELAQRKLEQRKFGTNSDLEAQRRNTEQKSRESSSEYKKKEDMYKNLFGSDDEPVYDYNEVVKEKTDNMNWNQRESRAATAKERLQYRNDKKTQETVDQVISDTEKERNRGTKYTEKYQQQQRQREFNDNLEQRSLIGSFFHKAGEGISGLFGNQAVRTDASGAVVNNFGSRNTVRNQYNEFIQSTFVAGGMNDAKNITMRDFKQGYQSISDELFGDFSNPYMNKSDYSGGILEWAKANPWKTAGAIAVTGVGAAGLMSRGRDGD